MANHLNNLWEKLNESDVLSEEFTHTIWFEAEKATQDAYQRGIEAGRKAARGENETVEQALRVEIVRLETENHLLRDALLDEQLRDALLDEHRAEPEKEAFYDRLSAPLPEFSHFMSRGDIDRILRRGKSEEGVRAWWTRPRHQLRGQPGVQLTPEQAWNLDRRREVYDLALDTLEQLGS